MAESVFFELFFSFLSSRKIKSAISTKNGRVRLREYFARKWLFNIGTYNGNCFSISVAAVTILTSSSSEWKVCSICKVFALSGKKRKFIKCLERCIDEGGEFKLFSGIWKDFIVETSHSEKDLWYIYKLCNKCIQIWKH